MKFTDSKYASGLMIKIVRINSDENSGYIHYWNRSDIRLSKRVKDRKVFYYAIEKYSQDCVEISKELFDYILEEIDKQVLNRTRVQVVSALKSYVEIDKIHDKIDVKTLNSSNFNNHRY